MSSVAPLRLAPPLLRQDVVRRDRLADRALRGQGQIVVVSGPAGSGKSVLLTQCYESADRPAWLSLSGDADDPAVLWLSLIDSIGAEIAGFGHRYRRRLAAAGSTVVDEVVALMSDELASSQVRIDLFLDDVHLIDNQETLRSLARFVIELPAAVRLFMATRHPAALPLARLRAEGRLTEFTHVELAMSVEEASALLLEQADRLGPVAVATLVERTEGWPAGLQLARLALRGVDDEVAFVSGFEGDDRFVADYLASQVLDALSEGQRDFLLETAFLPQLQGELCDAVTGRTGSATVLDELERRNAFVIALDRHRSWYRYHHLFADMLRSEARRLKTEDQLRVRGARAFEWFRDHGHPEAAVEQGLHAGRTNEVADLVAATWFDLLNNGRLQTAKRWIEAFKPEDVEDHQALCIAAALIAGMSGARLEARQFLAMAERGTYAGRPPDGSTSMASSLALARGTLAISGIDAARRDGEQVHELEPSGSTWHLLSALVVGLAKVMQGEPDGAIPYLVEAREAPDSAVRAYAMAELALIRLDRGDPLSASEMAEAARDLIREMGLDDLIMAAVAGGVAARAWTALDERDRAHRALEDAAQAMDAAQQALPMDAMHARLVMARAALELSDLNAARQHLGDALEAGADISDQGTMDSQLSALQSRLETISAATPSPPPDKVHLTEREGEVLSMLPTPLTTREIGRDLYLSVNTIKTYQRRIYRKLGVTSRDEAVEVARRLALLDTNAT